MESQPKEEINYIQSDQIIEPLAAMRSDFDEGKLAELAASIKQNGLINPITVRKIGEKFEIIAGHRRFLASCRVPLGKIPCVVKQLTDDEAFSFRAHENLFREDINPVDEALFIGKLIGTDESKIPAIARLVNRSENWIRDRLDILTYPDYFLPPLKDGHISLGVAKSLAAIDDEYYRSMFFNQALRDGMKTWQADYYLSQYNAGIFKKGEEIIPPDTTAGPSNQANIRQKCAKCGGMAEAPNLTNVFVHRECPPHRN